MSASHDAIVAELERQFPPNVDVTLLLSAVELACSAGVFREVPEAIRALAVEYHQRIDAAEPIDESVGAVWFDEFLDIDSTLRTSRSFWIYASLVNPSLGQVNVPADLGGRFEAALRDPGLMGRVLGGEALSLDSKDRWAALAVNGYVDFVDFCLDAHELQRGSKAWPPFRRRLLTFYLPFTPLLSHASTTTAKLVESWRSRQSATPDADRENIERSARTVTETLDTLLHDLADLTREHQAPIDKMEVSYREVATRPSEGEGRYIKQSGGRGLYGHAKIRLFPRKPGDGYEFVNDIVGGAIPREFIQSINQGIREAMTAGVLAGYPMEDVRIELYDGSYHAVDSNEIAFRAAGSLAFSDAAQRSAPVLFEAIVRIEVTVPEEYAGDVIAEIASRRGNLQSTGTRGGSQVIQAEVPLVEMLQYATELNTRTQGTGVYSMTFDRYEPAPRSVSEKIIATVRGKQSSI